MGRLGRGHVLRAAPCEDEGRRPRDASPSRGPPSMASKPRAAAGASEGPNITHTLTLDFRPPDSEATSAYCWLSRPLPLAPVTGQEDTLASQEKYLSLPPKAPAHPAGAPAQLDLVPKSSPPLGASRGSSGHIDVGGACGGCTPLAETIKGATRVRSRASRGA